MPQKTFFILIAAVVLAAALTLWLLTSFGVPPIYILLGAMVGSVVVRIWSRRS